MDQGHHAPDRRSARTGAIWTKPRDSAQSVGTGETVRRQRLCAVGTVPGASWAGDSNNNGEFNSGDLVAVCSAGEYEDAIAAFSDGGYELGALPAIAAVPEPSSAALLLIGLLACLRRRNR
ncbi:MAG: hypothetical protein CMJ77_08090 [Planctomycetaceae bacterium]|nr:hypothetical protein [Planctomycetaceae bacterium]